MERLFADSVYYVALLFEDDELHLLASELSIQTDAVTKVTTDAVLVEVLAYVSGRGSHLRGKAVALVQVLRVDPRVTILPQTREMFDAGFDLYRRRMDKEYSLTDCMSMWVCHDLGIRQVLTHDRHFAQERLEPLL